MRLPIMERVYQHLEESLKHFPEDRIVGIFLQGSQNYGLELPDSDVDTKLIITPTLEDIAMNRKPVSTTHVRDNEEHIDFKDIRLYIQTFRKQNLNFLEILFTPYCFVNPFYKNEWNRLVQAREEIAHMNPYRAVMSMKGVALEKYHALEHEYPSKIEILKKYGYDGKQLHHLQRIEEYLRRYIDGESYEDCLHPTNIDYLLRAKRCEYSLDEARRLANSSLEKIIAMTDAFTRVHCPEEDSETGKLLDDVQYNIIKIAILQEVNK